MELYKHSGAVPLAAVALITVAGGATALVGGAIYTYGINYIPLIYVNFLLTAGYGLVLGLAVGSAAKTGKLRNNFVLTSLAFVFGLLGIYVAWGVDPLARGGSEVGLSGFNPLFMLAYMEFLFEEGSWGLSDGEPVKGLFLAAIWLLESLVILGIAMVTARGMTAKLPFCDQCEAWTTVEEGVVHFATHGEDPRWDRVMMGDLSALNDLAFGITDEGTAVRLDLATCAGCVHSNFLTVQAAKYSLDKKGNVSEKLTPVFSWLQIDEAGVQLVRDRAREAEVQAEEETESEDMTLRDDTEDTYSDDAEGEG